MQIQLQMFCAKLEKGVLAVAASDFETSKEVKIIYVKADDQKLKQYMEKAETFWKNNVYRKLLKINI